MPSYLPLLFLGGAFGGILIGKIVNPIILDWLERKGWL